MANAPAKSPDHPIPQPDPETAPALNVNRQWSCFLRTLEEAADAPPDPLLPAAMRFHPSQTIRHLPNEKDRLALLQSRCLRLCAGDTIRAKRLAADVIWRGLS